MCRGLPSKRWFGIFLESVALASKRVKSISLGLSTCTLKIIMANNYVARLHTACSNLEKETPVPSQKISETDFSITLSPFLLNKLCIDSAEKKLICSCQ